MQIEERGHSKVIEGLISEASGFQELELEIEDVERNKHYSAIFKDEIPGIYRWVKWFLPASFMEDVTFHKCYIKAAGTADEFPILDRKIGELTNYFRGELDGVQQRHIKYRNDTGIYELTQEIDLREQPPIEHLAKALEDVENYFALSNFYVDGKSFMD